MTEHSLQMSTAEKMQTTSVADYIVQRIADEGVAHCFGVAARDLIGDLPEPARKNRGDRAGPSCGRLRPRRSIDYTSIGSSSRPSPASKLRPTGNQTWPFRRASPCLAKRFKVIPTALTWKSRSRICLAWARIGAAFEPVRAGRLQLIQHNFAKGRPSGAPAFLARAKFLTFAIFERVPNAGRQHIIEAQRTVGRLSHRLFWPRPFRNCAHPPHFFQKRGLPNVFPDGKSNLCPKLATRLDIFE